MTEAKKEPPPARPATTVLLLRPSKRGNPSSDLEVFMVVRHHQIDAFSGALVFPGGKLEDADGDKRLRARATGAASLSDDELKFRVAGIREAFEECGVLLAHKADVNAKITKNPPGFAGGYLKSKVGATPAFLAAYALDLELLELLQAAGADLKAINSGAGAALSTKKGGFAGYVYRDRKKPIIAAVDGLATAGGCEIVLASDLIVACLQRRGVPQADGGVAGAGRQGRAVGAEGQAGRREDARR